MDRKIFPQDEGMPDYHSINRSNHGTMYEHEFPLLDGTPEFVDPRNSTSIFYFPGCCPYLICIREREVGVIERFGMFDEVLNPGIHCLCFPGHTLKQAVSLRENQMYVSCGSKTSDDVFVTVCIMIHYKVMRTNIFRAVYYIDNPLRAMKNCAMDIMRSIVGKLSLDVLFSNSDFLVEAENRLAFVVNDFGIAVIKVLIESITPPKSIIASMNSIVVASLLRDASIYSAEANKISLVKSAESRAESKYLNGMGTAMQRQAIMKSFSDDVYSISEYCSSKLGSNKEEFNSNDSVELLLTVQYLNMLKSSSINKPPGKSMLMLSYDAGPSTCKKAREERCTCVEVDSKPCNYIKTKLGTIIYNV